MEATPVEPHRSPVAETRTDQVATKVAVNVGLMKTDDIQQKLKNAVVAVWNSSEIPAMMNIINNESGFEPCKINGGAVDCNYQGPRACGLGQFLPCSKLTNKCRLVDTDCQIKEIMAYVSQRYGSPTKAWNYHMVAGSY